MKKLYLALLTAASFLTAPAYAATCTLPDSPIQNTGSTINYSLPLGPQKNVTGYTGCVTQANQWNLRTDYQLNLLKNSPSNPFGAWTLMYFKGDLTVGVFGYSPLNKFVSPSDHIYCSQRSTVGCWFSLDNGRAGLDGIYPYNFFWLDASNGVVAYSEYDRGYGSVVRWLAPADGTYSLLGSLRMFQSCGNGNDFRVLAGGALLASGHLNPGAAATNISQSNISLKRGDSIYVLTKPVVSYPCQEVVFDLTVRR